ncbi:hypothetical protein ElyMa_003064200 [Elysia marginata]|uniref:Uncharacterized protein n=1 Tax=Elysia marginata TaxID=1093978 RepID=A0AAV4IKK2_9GAST|nr:hypothetical protein ElyMa_003064200 [Elysia marginata]
MDDTNYLNKNEPHAFRGVGSRKLTLDLASLNMRDRGRLLDPSQRHCCCCFVFWRIGDMGGPQQPRGWFKSLCLIRRLLSYFQCIGQEYLGILWAYREAAHERSARWA